MNENSYQYWLKVAGRHSRVADDAEDLLQEALLAAWREQRNPLAQGSEHAAWFAGVIRNQAAFRARSAVRARQREQGAVHDETAGPDGMLDDATREDWRQLAAVLPTAQRRVLLLALQGLGRKEICRVLDIPDATLRQRLTSLRTLLRGKLQAENFDMASLAATCAARILAANPPDTGVRRATLNRGPGQLATFRFGLSDPDGHMLGISGIASSHSAQTTSQKGTARQQTGGNDPETGA